VTGVKLYILLPYLVPDWLKNTVSSDSMMGHLLVLL